MFYYRFYSFVLLLFFSFVTIGQTYKIVDTGQSKNYNNSSEITAPTAGAAFYGQDAQFCGNQPSYTDNGDGTITDNVTGLMWSQTPDLNNDNKIDVSDKLSQADALAGASSFNLAGYTDWRLPTIKELYSLIMFYGEDPSGYNGTSTAGLVPFMNTDYFEFGYGDTDAGERIIDAQFATTTIYVSTTMNGDRTMFGVNLADGRIKGYPTSAPGGGSDKLFYVLYVRGTTDYGINDFVENSDSTVSDLATGLMWMQDDSQTGMNWEEALAWAQQKNSENYLGYDDWRLPDVKELQSIVDYTRSPETSNSAAIDPKFNCTKITVEDGSEDYPFYWSGTTHANMQGGSAGAYVAFGKALGWMQNQQGNYNLLDVHGAGAQRSDPKRGSADDYPYGHGPQGDVIRIDNYVRLVRTITDADSTGGDDSPVDSSDAVTLFAPLGNNNTYLIDSAGEVVNSWTSDYSPALSAYLLKDKSLLRTASLGPNGNSIFTGGGLGGKVERFDWDGNKIWEFEHNSETYLLHHDIEYLPNGNILMIAWEYKSETEALEAGRNPLLLNENELWPDKIIEVKPEGSSGGTIVWEWHAWDHLIQDYDNTKPNYGVVADNPEKINLNYTSGQAGADWMHTNGIDYNEEFDQIIVTVRNFSEIWIIDHNTSTEEAAGSAGDLLYRWGNPQTYDRGTAADQKLFSPHDGQWIPSEYPGEGDILIFNNGQNRTGGNYSSVDQFTPPVNSNGEYTISSGTAYGPASLSWTYTSNPTSDFYADHISGAQRLKDGNTLICEGTAGKFFEVTSAGEKIWEYINPYTFSTPQGDKNEVFRAVRYYLSELDGGDITSVTNNNEDVPTDYSLNQNYPNPFNPSTTIAFSMPESGTASIKIYNIIGQHITTLVNESLSAGYHSYRWNAAELSSGVYFYSLTVEGKVIGIKKMLLLK